MTPEQQRIAIAKARGWVGMPHETKQCYDPSGLSCYWSDCPDYLNDLNAMHEAEETLPVELQRGSESFTAWLWNICARDYTGLLHGDGSTWLLLRATAAQRAEAFLKTLNLWTE